MFGEDIKLVQSIAEVAKRKGCSLPQVALAWVVAQGKGSKEGRPLVVPIPGCKTIERLEENLTIVELNTMDMGELEKILQEMPVHGNMYGEALKKYMNM